MLIGRHGGRARIRWRATAVAIVADAEECVDLGVKIPTLPTSGRERGKQPSLTVARWAQSVQCVRERYVTTPGGRRVRHTLFFTP